MIRIRATLLGGAVLAVMAFTAGSASAQTVSPAGERTAEADAIRLDRLHAEQLEAEGLAAGLRLAGRRFVEMTEEHVGSEVVLFAAPEHRDA